MPPPPPEKRDGLTQEEFELWYLRDWNRLRRYFAKRLDPDGADDAVQDTFERAWRQRSGYDADHPGHEGWIWGIARHVLAIHRQSQIKAPEELSASYVDPEEAARLEDHIEVEALLSEMDPPSEELLREHYLDGRSQASLARGSDIARATMAERFHNLLKSLRGRL